MRCTNHALLVVVLVASPALAHPLLGSWNFPGLSCNVAQMHFAENRFWVTTGDVATLLIDDDGAFEDRWIRVVVEPAAASLRVDFADGSTRWYSFDAGADAETLRFEYERPSPAAMKRASRVDDLPIRRCENPRR